MTLFKLEPRTFFLVLIQCNREDIGRRKIYDFWFHDLVNHMQKGLINIELNIYKMGKQIFR